MLIARELLFVYKSQIFLPKEILPGVIHVLKDLLQPKWFYDSVILQEDQTLRGEKIIWWLQRGSTGFLWSFRETCQDNFYLKGKGNKSLENNYESYIFFIEWELILHLAKWNKWHIYSIYWSLNKYGYNKFVWSNLHCLKGWHLWFSRNSDKAGKMICWTRPTDSASCHTPRL